MMKKVNTGESFILFAPFKLIEKIVQQSVAYISFICSGAGWDVTGCYFLYTVRTTLASQCHKYNSQNKANWIEDIRDI